VEELCSGIRILNNIQELVLIVLQDTGAPVVVSAKNELSMRFRQENSG